MERYGKHIDAFKEDNKMTEMERVTYEENTLDINVPEDSIEQVTPLSSKQIHQIGQRPEGKRTREPRHALLLEGIP